MGAVPDDAPFVVRNSARRFVWQTIGGMAMVVAGALLVAFMGFTLTAAFALVVGVGVVAISVLSLRVRHPLLAADHSGVWLQAFPGPDGVRFYRWEDLQSLYVRTISRRPPFRMLCVLPEDVEAEIAANPQREATLRKSMELVGAPYSVNLVAASIEDEEALAALERLAAGRTSILRHPR